MEDKLPNSLNYTTDIKNLDIDMSTGELRASIGMLVDGEGLIRLRVTKNEKAKLDHSLSVEVSITQSYSEHSLYNTNLLGTDGELKFKLLNDNNPFLNSYSRFPIIDRDSYSHIGTLLMEIRIQNFCDRVDCHVNSRYKKKGERSNDPQLEFYVTGLDNVNKFLNEIHPYLTEKRPQSLIMQNEIIPLLKDKKHLNINGLLEIIKWRDKIGEFKGGVRGDFNLEYFKDYFAEEIEQRINIEEFYDNELSEEEESIFKE